MSLSELKQVEPWPLASETTKLLEEVNEDLYKNSYHRFSPEEMRTLVHGLGATDADIEALTDLFDSPAKRLDPGNGVKYVNTRFWQFRKESDDADLSEVWKTRKHAPHEAAVIDDQGFRGGNNGLTYRPYAATDDRMTVNPVMEAFMKILVDAARPMTNPERPGELLEKDGSRRRDILILQTTQQVCFEPEGVQNSTASPEGIHQDGADVVLVVFMKRHNVESGGESRLYDLEVPLGYHEDSEDASRLEHLLHPTEARFTMTTPLEAILMVDQNLKHEARGRLIPVDAEERAYRNVFTLHLRRPNKDGSDARQMEKAQRMPETDDTDAKLKWLQEEFKTESQAFDIAARIYYAHRAMVANRTGDCEQRVAEINRAYDAMSMGQISLAEASDFATQLEVAASSGC